MKTKKIIVKQALALGGVSVATGLGLTLVGGLPLGIGRVFGAGITSAAFIKSPEIIRFAVQNPFAFAIQSSGLVLGGFTGSQALGSLRGQKTITSKVFNSGRDIINRGSKAFYQQQVKLFKDKRGSVFLASAQLLKKKKKGKKKSKLEISREQALKEFEKMERVRKIKIIEIALRKEALEKGFVSEAALKNAREFMKKSGMKDFEVADIMIEIFRRQKIVNLRQNFKDGLVTKKDFGQQLTNLRNLKSQLVRRLREQKLIEANKIRVPQVQQAGGVVPLGAVVGQPKLNLLAGTQQIREFAKQRGIVQTDLEFVTLPLAQKQALRIQFNQSILTRQKLLVNQQFNQRVSLLQNQKSLLQQRLKEAQTTLQKQSLRQQIAQLTLQQQRQRQLQQTRLAQVSVLAQRQLQRSKQLQKYKLALAQVPLLAQKAVFGRPTRRVRRLRRVGKRLRKPKKPKPRKFFLTEKEMEKKKQRLKKELRKKKGYNVFVKQKGKFFRVNEVPLTKKKAKGLGAFITDKSLSATWKIKKTNKKAKKPVLIFPTNYHSRTQHKFRGFKLKKGKKVPLKNSEIEKRKFRLDQFSEVKRIQAARFVKQLSRRLKKVKPLIQLKKRKKKK